MQLLNVAKWKVVRARGRSSLVRRMSIIGATGGLVVSLPLWLGAYRFYTAATYPVAKILAVAASILPLFAAALHAGMAFAVWRLNEWLFAKSQQTGLRAT